MQNVMNVTIIKNNKELTVKCTGYSPWCMFGKIIKSKPRAVVDVKNLQNSGGVVIRSNGAFWSIDAAFMNAKQTCALCPRTLMQPLRIVRSR